MTYLGYLFLLTLVVCFLGFSLIMQDYNYIIANTKDMRLVL